MRLEDKDSPFDHEVNQPMVNKSIDSTLRNLEEAMEDVKLGRIKTFETIEDLFENLDGFSDDANDFISNMTYNDLAQ